jgi:hypothetical protein
MEEMLSLYDYLCRAAGPQLGKEVYKAAIANNIPMTIKTVSNPVYSGKIQMYPKSFLDKYFNKTIKNYETNDLPF